MSTNIERKCTKCGTWNGEVDTCINCYSPVSIKEIERVEQQNKAIIAANRPKEKLDVIFEKYKNHPFFLVRWTFFIVNSVFMLFLGIGSLITYFIAWTAG